MILSQPLKLDIYIQDKYLQISISRQDIQFPFCPQKQLAQMLWIKCYYLDMYICYYFHSLKVSHPHMCVNCCFCTDNYGSWCQQQRDVSSATQLQCLSPLPAYLPHSADINTEAWIPTYLHIYISTHLHIYITPRNPQQHCNWQWKGGCVLSFVEIGKYVVVILPI